MALGLAPAGIPGEKGTLTSDQVLLSAAGIQKSFDGNAVLTGVDLALRRGECVLLTGENGSGKTSLINILTGNLEPDAGRITYSKGHELQRFVFPQRWWQRLIPWNDFCPEFVARAGVGRSWQAIRLFGSLSLRDNLAVAKTDRRRESPLLALFENSRAREQASSVLSELGLTGRDASSGDKISLGQSKRVAIARAIEAGAQMIFLDEPLAGLDQQGIADVLAYLRGLIDDHQATFVIVEHIFNQPYLLPLVTTKWALCDGKLVQTQIAAPDHAEVANLKQKSRQPTWIRDLAGKDRIITEEELPRSGVLTKIRSRSTKAVGEPFLAVADLVVRRGERPAVGVDSCGDEIGLSLAVHPGEIVILQAPNGWGKTTLFDCVTGRLRQSQGTISICGESVDDECVSSRANAGLVAVPSANPQWTISPADTVHLAKGEYFAWADQRVLGKRSVSDLSGGQQKVLSLACGNRPDAKVLLFDEPMNALDQEALRHIVDWIRSRTDVATILLVPSVH